MKALLLTLSCLLLLAVACGGEDVAPDSGSSSGSTTLAPDRPLGPDTASPDTSVAPSNATALPDKLVVTTNIELQVAALRQAYVEISGYARSHGGFVADAKLTDDGEQGFAFLRLRVPSTRHDDMVAQVRAFPNAELKREDSTAKEVTAEYIDLQSRLANLRATEAQYGQLLARTGTIEEVLQVTAKLDEVRGDIEQLEGRIKLIEDQADYATVSVQLALPPPAAERPAPAGGLSSPVEVLRDASSTSLTVAHAFLNIAIVLFVAGLWIVPAILVGLLARRRLRRPFETVKAWFG